MPKKSQSASQDAVAKRANVSTATVSRVINRARGVTRDTADRVYKACQELGVDPATLVRGNRHPMTGVIGLLLSDVSNPFYASLLRGVETALYRKHFSLFVASTDEEEAKERFYLEHAAGLSVDGLIIAPTSAPDVLLDNLQDKGTPIVFVDRKPPRFSGPLVGIDNVTATRELVVHLSQVHHRTRIGIILGPTHAFTTARERLDGYRLGLEDVGLAFDPHLVRSIDLIKTPLDAIAGDLSYSDVVVGQARLVVGDLLEQNIDGLIGGNNRMALGALLGLHDRKIAIPQQVSFISFEDLEAGELLSPPLSAVHHPSFDIGARAADLLVQLLRREQLPEPIPCVPTRFVPRESCGCGAEAADRA